MDNLPQLVYLVLGISLSFLMAYISIPVVIRIVKDKNLYDRPNERSAATTIVPTLGGIAIFIGVVLGTIIGSYKLNFPELNFIIASMVVLFFIGLKDDILVIAPLKKLIAQVIAAAILFVFAGIRFTNLHGLFGIHEIGIVPSALITVFSIIVITNAFNLIDGIDGLASGLAMTIGITLGTWFYLTQNFGLSLLSFTLVASLAVFFYFNVFSKTNKIFMGDTGSLILGLIFSVLIIRFNEINISYKGFFAVENAPAVSIGILIVPLFDTLRVFVIRMLSGKSPFSPDKNHVHHRMLDLGFTHFQSTIRIILINIFFIILNLSLQSVGIYNLLLINISMAAIFSVIPAYIIFKRSENHHLASRYFIFQLKYQQTSKEIQPLKLNLRKENNGVLVNEKIAQ